MALFRKREKVPEVPPAPKLFELPEVPIPEPPEASAQTNELPFLPDNLGQNLNQEMVKSAVSDSDPFEENQVKIESLPKGFNIREEKQVLPEIPRQPEIPRNNIYEKRTLELSPVFIKPETREEKPVFIRVDKFQIAQRDFQNIKQNIKSIEAAMLKLNSIKIKEDAEISGWIQNLEKIKARLSEIDSNIFNKL